MKERVTRQHTSAIPSRRAIRSECGGPRRTVRWVRESGIPATRKKAQTRLEATTTQKPSEGEAEVMSSYDMRLSVR